MNEDTPATATGNRKRNIAIAAAVGAAGLVAGGVLASALSASAESSTAQGAAYGGGYAASGQPADPSKPMRSDEHLLTGTTKEKVTAVVTKKYPDATIQRVETDSDGVYEAHVVNAGQQLIVQVGKDFTITGTQTGGGPGGPGGHGDGDGDGPGSSPQG